MSARGLLGRSLILGALYAAAQMLVTAALGTLSGHAPRLEEGLTWWLSGTLLALVLAPFIRRSTWPQAPTMLAVWAAIALVRSLGTGLEGSIFRPTEANRVVIGSLTDAGVGLLTAWLAVRLLMGSQPRPSRQPSPPRTAWGWTWRVLLVGLAYVALYFIFGAANAFLYTLSFYQNNPQYGLALPPVGTILLAQLIRGPLFGLGALILARLTDMPRRWTAVSLGLVLFVLGGLGPYVETTFRSMPLGFNLATLTELFLQNFFTGVVAAILYGTRATEPSQAPGPAV